MTHGQRHHRRRSSRRHTCMRCGERRALAHFPRGWAARKDHDLCPRCWQSALDRARARQLQLKTASPWLVGAAA